METDFRVIFRKHMKLHNWRERYDRDSASKGGGGVKIGFMAYFLRPDTVQTSLIAVSRRST